MARLQLTKRLLDGAKRDVLLRHGPIVARLQLTLRWFDGAKKEMSLVDLGSEQWRLQWAKKRCFTKCSLGYNEMTGRPGATLVNLPPVCNLIPKQPTTSGTSSLSMSSTVHFWQFLSKSFTVVCLSISMSTVLCSMPTRSETLSLNCTQNVCPRINYTRKLKPHYTGAASDASDKLYVRLPSAWTTKLPLTLSPLV